jgi:hypothetical protein
MIDNHVIVDCVFSVDESSRALPLLTVPMALLAVSTRYIETLRYTVWCAGGVCEGQWLLGLNGVGAKL